MIKAVIFDLDGTLIDTEKLYRIFWPKALEKFGYEMSDERALYVRSLGKPYSPVQFKEWYGEDFDFDKVRDYRRVIFEEYVDTYGLERKAGAVELLEYLRSKKMTTAIASATEADRAKKYLKMTGLEGYFDKILSAKMVEHGKPSPEVYLFASEQLGLRPEECLAVEDAPNGIKAAYGAGCKVAMVPDQSEPDEELAKMLDYCVPSLDKLMEIDVLKNL